MDALLTAIVTGMRAFLPALLWDMFVRKINELENKRQQAELEAKYAQNELKVIKDSAGKSAHELLLDAAAKGNGDKPKY